MWRKREYFAVYRDDKLSIACMNCKRTLGKVMGRGDIIISRPCLLCRLLRAQFTEFQPERTLPDARSLK